MTREEILQRLEEIEARVAEATPGPWESDGVRVYSRLKNWGFGLVCDCDLSPAPEGEQMPLPHDPDFIAHAREDVPWLCQAIRNLLTRQDKLLESCELARRALTEGMRDLPAGERDPECVRLRVTAKRFLREILSECGSASEGRTNEPQ